MKQILNMYRLTKLVDDIAEQNETHEPSSLQLITAQGYSISHPNILIVKKKFVEKYRNVNMKQAHEICADALHETNHFMECHPATIDGIAIHTLCLTREGRELIDNFLFIPWGLMRAWTRQYGTTLTLLGTLGLGVCISFTLSLLKTVWLHIHHL